MPFTAKTTIPASTPSMTITISNSMRVKPASFFLASRIRFNIRVSFLCGYQVGGGELMDGDAHRVVGLGEGERLTLVGGGRDVPAGRDVAVDRALHHGLDLG